MVVWNARGTPGGLLFRRRIRALGGLRQRRAGKLSGSLQVDCGIGAKRQLARLPVVPVPASPARLCSRLHDEIQAGQEPVRDFPPGSAGLEIFKRLDCERLPHVTPRRLPPFFRYPGLIGVARYAVLARYPVSRTIADILGNARGWKAISGWSNVLICPAVSYTKYSFVISRSRVRLLQPAPIESMSY